MITRNGYNKLKEELNQLISVERPRVIELIENSRVIGDADMEDSDYMFAKDEQDRVENRICYISNLLDDSKPVDIKGHYDNVEFGATITLMDVDTEKTVKYTIVSSIESDPSHGLISIEAPIIKELIGASVGDSACFNDKEYELLSIQ